jgi:hypothetical protein
LSSKKNQYAVCKISGDTTCGISGLHQSPGNAGRGAFLHKYKSENFALTLYEVWLLVRAVTGGASDGYGKKTSFPASI